MLAARAAVVLSLALAAPAAGASGPALSGAPPRLLNIVRVRIKPGAAASYAALETQIVRAYDRAKLNLYWICLQSTRDPSEVLYLNFYDSREAADRAKAVYRESVADRRELVALTDRLRAMTASDATTLFARRDDADQPPAGVDFGTMRQLRLTSVQVQAGREGDFIDAIRTVRPKGRSWLVYEANDTSAYALIALKRTPFGRADGPALPRSLRRSQGVYTSAETRVYAVRPAMSRVPASFLR